MTTKIAQGPSSPVNRNDQLAELLSLSRWPARAPAVAVADESGMHEQRTYGELDAAIGATAAELQDRGVGVGDRVGILVSGAAEDVVAMLATLKLGAAYVPVDGRQPAARQAETLGGCEVCCVVAQQPHTGEELGLRVPRVEVTWSGVRRQRSPSIPQGEELAYIMHTSGSTGRPVGVGITRSNLAYSTQSRLEYYQSPVGRFLLLSPMTFDSSVAGIYWTLATGGQLVIPSKRQMRELDRLPACISAVGVTHLLCLPSVWERLLRWGSAAQYRSLQTVMVAGEPCGEDLPQRHDRLVPNATLFNEYGPTEATVWCSVARLTRPLDRVSIGHPIAGTELHLLDREGCPVDDGDIGEIYIEGPGVGAGYVAASSVMEGRFRRQGLARLFQTGDRARRRADGSLVFVGRNDDQVKLRGRRVELREVETVLGRLPGIHEAVALVDGHVLVACVVTDNGHPRRQSELMHVLRQWLPDYLIPRRIELVSSLPKTPHGKVDRRAVRAQMVGRAGRRGSAAAAASSQAEGIARICSEVLQRPAHPDDNFFELGGDSLSALDFALRLESYLGRRPSPAELFSASRLSDLADGGREAGSGERTIVCLRKGGGGPPLILFPPGGGEFLCYLPLARALSTGPSVYALSAPPCDVHQPLTVPEIASHLLDALDESLSGTSPVLCGWSFGGLLAYEAAWQLQERGTPPAQLVMLDAGVLYSLAVVKRFFPGAQTPLYLLASVDLDRFLPEFRRRGVEAGILAPGADTESVRGALERFAAHLAAAIEYRPSRYKEAAVLIEARESWCDDRRRPHREWMGSCPHLEVQRSGGDHVTMLQTPRVRGLACRLGKILGRAEHR